MPNKFAQSNGNFNDNGIWSLLPGSLSPTTSPDANDVAYANGRTIFITQDATCQVLINDNTNSATAGGRYYLQDGVTLRSNISGSNVAATFTLTYSGSNFANIIGNIIGYPSGTRNFNGAVGVNGTGTLNITAQHIAGSFTHGISAINRSSLSIRTNVSVGGNNAQGVFFNSTGTLYISAGIITGGPNGAGGGIGYNIDVSNCNSAEIIGDFYGGVNPIAGFGSSFGVGAFRNIALFYNASGPLIIRGNIYGDHISQGISSNPNGMNGNGNYPVLAALNGPIYVYGNIYAGPVSSAINVIGNNNLFIYNDEIVAHEAGQSAIHSQGTANIFIKTKRIQSATGVAAINAPSTTFMLIDGATVINSPDGRQAINSPVYILTNNTLANNYITYPTEISPSATLNNTRYQLNSFATFSTPPASSVRVNAPGGVTGTCRIPPVSAVAFGVAYNSRGQSIGTAVNLTNVIFNVPLSGGFLSGSIGDKVAKATTIEAIGHQIASFSN